MINDSNKLNKLLLYLHQQTQFHLLEQLLLYKIKIELNKNNNIKNK